MPVSKKIAIVSPCSIFNRGLQDILDDFFNHTDTHVYNNIDDFISQCPEMFDLYFLSGDDLISQYEFFLPRKNKTIIFTHKLNYKAPFHILKLNYSLSDTVDNLQQILSKIESPATKGYQEDLSLREIDVLKLIVKGFINKDIADKLCISLNTVLTHRKNITSKLGIKSVSGLTFYAMMNGLISEND